MGIVYSFDGWNTKSYLKIKKGYWKKVEKKVKEIDYPIALEFDNGFVILKNGSKMWCGYDSFVEFLEWLEPYVGEDSHITITRDCDEMRDEFYYSVEDGKTKLSRNTEYGN